MEPAKPSRAERRLAAITAAMEQRRERKPSSAASLCRAAPDRTECGVMVFMNGGDTAHRQQRYGRA
jgi:hypothetical protein